jgi:hypothetical protein
MQLTQESVSPVQEDAQLRGWAFDQLNATVDRGCYAGVWKLIGKPYLINTSSGIMAHWDCRILTMANMYQESYKQL